MLKQCNLVELFSGIGSQAKALKNLGVQVNILGTCEWDVHAIAAYDVIHNSPELPADIEAMGKEQLLDILKKYTFSNSGKTPLEFKSLRTYSVEVLRRIYASITRNNNFVDVSQLEGTKLPENIDILTYSFPCQDLSNVGAFHGYNKGIDKESGSRSSLLWQVGRILTEMKNAKKMLPRFLVMENVPTLLSDRHLGNFNTWIMDLEDLGYISQYYQLNATSFGLPQNRPRLLMISVYVGDDIEKWKLVSDYFDAKKETADIVSDYRASGFFSQYTVQQLLRTNYTNRKIMAEAIECTPNDTVSRRKIWEENPQIILSDGTFNTEIDAVRTITTKQDRNPNSGNLYFESGIEGRSKFRYLTPRECLLFMGFTDDDFKQLRKYNAEFHKGDALFARDKIIRMAGNSIPVKLLEGIFYQILQLDKMLKEQQNQQQASISDENNNDCSSILRSHIFKSGIRSRVGNSICPGNASLVYPKYKTAIYIKNCFDQMSEQKSTDCALCNHRYWKKRCETSDKACIQQCSDALSMGWNAVVVKACDLCEERREETLDWIVQCIKDGNVDEHQGRVISRG